MEEQIKDIDKIIEMYKNHILPYDIYVSSFNSTEYKSGDASKYSILREVMISSTGYSIVTKRLCKALAEIIGNHKALEVCCGKGVLAKGLRDEDIEVKATDNFSWLVPEFFNNCWIDDIEKIDADDAIAKYGDDHDILILSWPPCNNLTAYMSLIEMRKVNPNMQMIYIGESEGGNCANSLFFEEAIEIKDNRIDKINSEIFRQHFGMNDKVKLYR